MTQPSKRQHDLHKRYQALAQVISITKVKAHDRAFNIDEASDKVFAYAIDKTIDILLVELCNWLKREDDQFDEDKFFALVFKP